MAEDKVYEELELDTISKRLKYAINESGLKHAKMAEKLGVSKQTLSNILNDRSSKKQKVDQITKLLGLNEEWVKTGEGNIYGSTIKEMDGKIALTKDGQTITLNLVPLYYPDQIKLHYLSQQAMKAHDYVVTMQSYVGKLIATLLTADLYSPKFEVGDIMLFEQTKNILENKLYLVYSFHKKDIFLGTLVNVGNDEYILSAPGISFKVNLNAGDAIVGTLRECFKRLG